MEIVGSDIKIPIQVNLDITTVWWIFVYDGRYAWSQSHAYQVRVICIWRILQMTDQFPGPIESVISKFAYIVYGMYGVHI